MANDRVQTRGDLPTADLKGLLLHTVIKELGRAIGGIDKWFLTSPRSRLAKGFAE